MTWTTFAQLGTGPGTTPQLDANFAALSVLTPIPCTIVGTNTLTLTSIAGAAAISSFANYMTFIGVAANTNNGAVTAAVVGIAGALSVYKDTQAGPQLCVGGEIVANCAFSFQYDSALNSGAGGFHLRSGAGSLVGQTINVAGLQLNSNDALTRLNSTLATVTLGTVGPGGQATASLTLAGVQLGDNVLLGMPASFLSGSAAYIGYVAAAGTINIRVSNPTATTTVTSQTLGIRFTALGFLT